VKRRSCSAALFAFTSRRRTIASQAAQIRAMEAKLDALLRRLFGKLPGEIPPRKCGGKSAEVVVAENKPGSQARLNSKPEILNP
jgi:hypothetical protein